MSKRVFKVKSAYGTKHFSLFISMNIYTEKIVANQCTNIYTHLAVFDCIVCFYW